MLIRSEPFPGELDRGYLGRVMRINGATTEKYAVELMSIWAGVADKSRREVSCLELLSKVAGVDVSIFVRQHTILPFWRGISALKPHLLHGNEQKRSLLRSTEMQLSRKGAYFCADCVNEDQNFHGQSYWRREHQIPGMLWCLKHATPLKYTEDESAFLLPPAAQLQHCQSVDEEQWVKQAFNNKAIQRYQEICSSLLNNRKPFDVKYVLVKLQEKACEFGFPTRRDKVKTLLLSDTVIDAFGRTWLDSVLPALADKPKGWFLGQMDGVLNLKTSIPSVIAYVLALAVLYESADMAMNALQPSAVPITRSRQRSTQFTREELLEAYIQGRGNYSTITSNLSIGDPKIEFNLAAIGLPNLAKQGVFKAVLAFYVEKQSLQVSVATGDIELEVMEDLIRNAGSDLTRALQAMQRPSERGTCVRSAWQLTPAEASLATGPVATKFSPNICREQLLAQELRSRSMEEYRT